MLEYQTKKRIIAILSFRFLAKESNLLLMAFGVSLIFTAINESPYLGLISVLLLIGAAICSAIEKTYYEADDDNDDY